MSVKRQNHIAALIALLNVSSFVIIYCYFVFLTFDVDFCNNYPGDQSFCIVSLMTKLEGGPFEKISSFVFFLLSYV